MTDIPNLDLLLENKAKTDQALAEYADALREQLQRLDSMIQPPKVKPQVTDIKRRLIKGILLILIGMFLGNAFQNIPAVIPNNISIVQPKTESLEDFAARESKALTEDERHKLLNVADKVLQQHFTKPSALAEEFTLQRRLAGIDSPAFQTFSERWAAKVEKIPVESIEDMQKVYQSLLEGLRQVNELVPDEKTQEASDSKLLTPNPSITPSPRRQRFFRSIPAAFTKL